MNLALATEVSMSEDANTVEGWARNSRPPNLYRRFAFRNYAETSVFLDRLAELSKQTGYYPDISFGKVYANVTVHASDGEAIREQDLEFAAQANTLVASTEADE